MKKLIVLPLLLLLIVISCKTTDKTMRSDGNAAIANDTIRIANKELEYEIIIIDPGFNSWFVSHAKPRNYYSQPFLEARNTIWVSEWNNRALQPSRYGDGLYEMRIDYQPGIDYGYEVNYMLFNYLTYFQLSNRIKLGGFEARL